MKQTIVMLAFAAGLVAWSVPAQADVDIEGVLLLGTGVDTGDANNNPYALQFGGAAELTVAGYVIGVRATRSVATGGDSLPIANDSQNNRSPYVKDLRAFGVDLGIDWELAILHLSPRLGIGHLSEKDGDRVAAYVEPGGVAEVELGWFVAGVDLRYRFAIKESDANGFLAYARAGLRF
jgi:hypothetical protein